MDSKAIHDGQKTEPVNRARQNFNRKRCEMQIKEMNAIPLLKLQKFIKHVKKEALLDQENKQLEDRLNHLQLDAFLGQWVLKQRH